MTTIHENIIYMTDDRLRLLEDQVWAELSQEIDAGTLDSDGAIDKFLDWRAEHKAFGSFAVHDTVQIID